MDRERELAELGDYVRLLADRMGLRDWAFEVSEVDDEQDDYGLGDEAFAVDQPDRVDKRAAVLVDRWFFRRSPEQRRASVTRHLLVCHSIPLWDHVRSCIDDADFSIADEFRFEKSYLDFVAPIANAWAPCLPLPLVGLMRRPVPASA